LKRERTRKAEKEQRRLHVPVDEKPIDEPPPFVILVHGPPQACSLSRRPGTTGVTLLLLRRLASRRLSSLW